MPLGPCYQRLRSCVRFTSPHHLGFAAGGGAFAMGRSPSPTVHFPLGNDLWEYTPASPTAVREPAAAPFQEWNAADGTAWLTSIAPLGAGNTLNVLDLDGRVLNTRSLPNGVPLNFHLPAKELGAVLRIRTLQGAQPWTGRVVLGP